MRKIKITKNIIYDFIAVIIIIMCCLIFVGKRTIPLVMNDEFGYWGNAYALLSDSWSSLLGITPYYSMGYSILLLPIMMITNNTEYMYQYAIVLNVFFMIANYFIIKYIARVKLNIDNYIYRVIISVTVLLTCENLMHSQIAWSETLLTFLMWLSVALFVSLEKKYRYRKVVFLASIWLYMYIVHQRAIGVILVGVFCLLCISYFKGKRAVIIGALALLPMSIVVQKVISNFQMLIVFANSPASDINVLTIDSSLVDSLIAKIRNSTPDLINSFVGKVFYLTLSSCFAGIVAIYVIVKDTLKKIYNKLFTDIDIGSVYIGLSLIAMLLLTTVRMYGNGRMDLVVYSRYFEFTIGPIFLFGLHIILSRFYKYRDLVISIFCFLIIVGERVITVIESSTSEFNMYCSPYLGAIYYKLNELLENINYVSYTIYFSLLITFVLVAVIIWVNSSKKKYSKGIICVIIIAFNLGLFNCLDTQMMSWQNDLYRGIDPIIEELNEDKDKKIYYSTINCETGYGNQVKYLQYILGERAIEVINTDIESITDNSFYLIVDGNVNDTYKNIDKVCSSYKYTLYER